MCAADGVSIRQNNERAAGQDVLHLHFHVIPRFADDGFTGLDRSQGAVEVPVEQRVQQAQNLAEGLRRLQESEAHRAGASVGDGLVVEGMIYDHR